MPIKGYTDYVGLVNYSQTIEQNYKRLSATGYKRELSNSTVTNEIVQKLPSQIISLYMRYFFDLDKETKSNPLPVLIKWIEKERNVWEYQETSTVGIKKDGVYAVTTGIQSRR